MTKKPKKSVDDEKIKDEPGAQERFAEATKRLLSTPPKPKKPVKSK